MLGLCFQSAPEPPARSPRQHLDLIGGSRQATARRLDVGQGEMSWVVLADPSGNEYCVLPARS